MSGHVRRAEPRDLPAFERIVEGVALFPAELLAEMIAPFFAGTGQEFWLTYDDGDPVGIIYCAPERMTEGTWNQLLVAVDPRRQRQGIGAALMLAVEQRLAAAGQRLLLVETSDLPQYEGARGFYRAIGYHEEARIRDFYQAGEDKIVFSKPLS